MANLNRMSRLINVLAGIKRLKETPTVLEETSDILEAQNKYLRNLKLRRDLAAPSPSEKYMEEQRREMVGSAIEMFGELYKTASPASKKLLGEQMGSLWNMLDEGDKTKLGMIVKHTPLNPRVQKAKWFEETNPMPQMPIIREGDGSFTNSPPRTPEYRRIWAEYDIAMDEWNTLRKMAVEDKKQSEVKKAWKVLPKQYQTDDTNVTAYRDPVDRSIRFFDWKAVDQAEVATAVEKGWATQSDMMATGVVPLAEPSEYTMSGNPVSIVRVKDVIGGGTKLKYDFAGPVKESDVTPPKDLIDAIHLVDTNTKPSKLKIKSAATVAYYNQLMDIVNSKGEERRAKQEALQMSIIQKYPSPERFIPFIPEPARRGKVWTALQYIADWTPGLAFFIPTPGTGKEGNIALLPADRMVTFYDKEGTPAEFWWSDVYKIAYDMDGTPVRELKGKVEGSRLGVTWEELEK